MHEADGFDPRMYNCTFPALIDDWRAAWHFASNGQTPAQFPFGFVQLNAIDPPNLLPGPAVVDPFDDYNDSFPSKMFAPLRWAQSAGFGYAPNARQPNTWMAVTLDTPSPGKDVGVHSVRD